MKDNPQEAYTDFVDLIEGHPQGADSESVRWSVTDDNRADYALRKLAQLQAEKNKRAAFVASEIERLKTFQVHEDMASQRSMDFFEAHLALYADELKRQGILTEKRKTYKLPHGSIGYRSMQAEYGRDEQKILEWVMGNPSLRERYTKVVYKLDWYALRSTLAPLTNQPLADVATTDTGDIVPGVQVTRPAGDVFVVKVEE